MLLGNLCPIMVIGMARVLAEDGADVIGQEQHPSSIVTAAGRTQPDVVVLDISTEGSRELELARAAGVPGHQGDLLRQP